MLSASIAYYALASLFPGLLLLLTLSSLFVSGTQAQERLLQIVSSYIPVPSITEYLRANLHAAVKFRGIMGFISSVVLLWSCKGAFLAAEQGLNTVWRIQNRRHTMLVYLTSIGATVFVGALLLAQFLLGAVLRTLLIWGIPVLGLPHHHLRLITNTIAWLVSPVVLFVIFLCTYSLLPTERHAFSAVWKGTLFATVAYRVVEQAFIVYVAYSASMTVVYGAASGLIALMLWMYLAANIFFLGAELIYVLVTPLETGGKAGIS